MINQGLAPLSEHLRRFLSLCAETGLALVPSPVIDEEWHQALSHEADYENWCQMNLGTIVRHLTTTPVDVSQYETTITLITKLYGPQPPAIWPSSRALRASDLRCMGKAIRN